MSFNSSSENNSGVAREDAAAYLRNASFSRGDGSAPSAAVTAADLLNATSFDPSRLHPMAGISDKLDYLALDDEKTNALPGAGTALPSRGWSDDLCYGTGTTYLSALMYNVLNSSIDAWRGKHDVWGSMAAGGISGAIYKSTAGVRPALAAAGIMTGLAGTWSWIKRTII
ncbi:Mitochondrial import inner membrane translocase subunit tim23 [Rhizoctonia solani]